MPRFLLLTFAITWPCFFGAAYVAPGWRTPVVLLGTFAPGIVALLITGRDGGSGAVAALLLRLVQGRVWVRWYVFAAGFMVAIKLGVALIHRLAAGVWPRFGTESLLLMAAATIISTVSFGQAGEELGWRGYALPRLAARFGLGAAGIILGVIWAVWHLPLFFLPGADTFGQSFPLYLLQVTALSVAMTWLYAHTRGGLLPLMLMHAAVNNTKDIVPSLGAPLVAWLTMALLWCCAAYFLIRMRRDGSPAPELAATSAASFLAS